MVMLGKGCARHVSILKHVSAMNWLSSSVFRSVLAHNMVLVNIHVKKKKVDCFELDFSFFFFFLHSHNSGDDVRSCGY